MTYMKPFDLEAAKAGAPVITRAGFPARIGFFDRKTSDGLAIFGLIEFDNGLENVCCWDFAGRALRHTPGIDSSNDLAMDPVKKFRTVWINVYPRTSFSHESKLSAENGAGPDRIACVETVIKWEE